jgi:hypothetical protein
VEAVSDRRLLDRFARRGAEAGQATGCQRPQQRQVLRQFYWSDEVVGMARAREASGSALRRVCIALGVLALVLPRGASADVLAVLAGIDDYQHVAKLGGAVSDARISPHR